VSEITENPVTSECDWIKSAPIGVEMNNVAQSHLKVCAADGTSDSGPYSYRLDGQPQTVERPNSPITLVGSSGLSMICVGGQGPTDLQNVKLSCLATGTHLHTTNWSL
jgi:hypothetical protein